MLPLLLTQFNLFPMAKKHKNHDPNTFKPTHTEGHKNPTEKAIAAKPKPEVKEGEEVEVKPEPEVIHNEMALYEKHEKVYATNIREVGKNTNGSFLITPAESGLKTINVAADLGNAYYPQKGDYYLIKEDGTQQFMSAEEFEKNYTKVEKTEK